MARVCAVYCPFSYRKKLGSTFRCIFAPFCPISKKSHGAESLSRHTSCSLFGSSPFWRIVIIASARRSGRWQMQSRPPKRSSRFAAAHTSSKVHMVSCRASCCAPVPLKMPRPAALYGGLQVTRSYLPFSAAGSARKSAQHARSKTFVCVSSIARLNCAAPCSRSSTPSTSEAASSLAKISGIMPHPVPRSQTRSLLCGAAKCASRNASVPKACEELVYTQALSDSVSGRGVPQAA